MSLHGPRILMVLDQRYPVDVRVENEARTLIDAGFQIGLLAIGPDERPAEEICDGVRVFRDRIPASVRNKMRGLAGTIPLYSPYLAFRIQALNRRFAFDALHVHDLYLFGGGIRAARRLGVPIVGDLHENWVEALRGYAWSNRPLARLLINYKRWERLERRWTTAVDRLVVVIEEAVERNVQNGVDPARVVLVPNTLAISEFENLKGESVHLDERDDRIHLMYVGGIDRHRGLETVVDAMPEILRVEPRAILHIVGEGRTRHSLHSRSVDNGLREHVVFHGWQALPRVKAFIEASDICLVPHLRTPHTDATIPHKLFQYMYCGRPVVVSNCRPLERIVADVSCGRIFEAGSAASFAREVIGLLSSRREWKDLGTRGREAVLHRYNWTTTSKSLVRAYDELLRS